MAWVWAAVLRVVLVALDVEAAGMLVPDVSELPEESAEAVAAAKGWIGAGVLIALAGIAGLVTVVLAGLAGTKRVMRAVRELIDEVHEEKGEELAERVTGRVARVIAPPEHTMTDHGTGIEHVVPNGDLRRDIMGSPYAEWLGLWLPNERRAHRLVMAYVNPVYAACFGVDELAYRGRTHWDVYPEELAERYHRNDEYTVRFGAMRFAEETGAPLDGGPAPFAGGTYMFLKRVWEREGVLVLRGCMMPPLDPTMTLERVTELADAGTLVVAPGLPDVPRVAEPKETGGLFPGP